MLAAIMIGPNRQLVNVLRDVAAQFEDLCIYKILTVYPGPNELASLLNVFTPEIVFLEAGSDMSLTVALEIREFNPKTSVIAFSAGLQADQTRALKAAGVTELLVAPFSADHFRNAILRSIEGHASAVANNVVAFLPGKAGSGATTTALNVAAALVRDWKQQVLLLEADHHSGALAFLLDLDPESFSLQDALANAEWLDDSAWARLPSRFAGIELLPGRRASKEEPVSRWQYHRLLTFVRSRYDIVLVDLGEIVPEGPEAFITQARDVFVVCTPEKASLNLARRRMHQLQSQGVNEKRLHVVMNRCWDRNARWADAEAILERSISVFLPEDELELRRAAQDSRLIRRESALGRAFSSFAQVMAGLQPAAPSGPGGKKTSWKFLSFNALQHS